MILKRPRISPLRFPGGKVSLYIRLKSMLRSNNLIGGTYVEPYAGGAGAALALLATGQVQRVVLNDLDTKLFAFWRAVTENPHEFSQMISRVDLSIAEWERQKRIYATADRHEYLSLGFATFYLNRTNRSGTLNGGPIGGKSQTGKYLIDARFNRADLIERVRLISLYANRIELCNQDGVDIIQRFAPSKATFIYADPPYFQKAGSLYLHAFQASDHQALAECLNQHADSNWLLTYDNDPEVARLYPDRRREEIAVGYSAHRVVKAKELMVFADNLASEEPAEL